MRFIQFLNEVYSNELVWLISAIRDKAIDPYMFETEIMEWLEERYPKLAEKFTDPEMFYELPVKIQREFIEENADDLTQMLMQYDPANAPSWMHFDFRGRVHPETWLVHFNDSPWEIAKNGFIFGTDDPRLLGLTTYYKQASKKRGGYNFAFVANSRYAEIAVRDRKYGTHAVLFQSAGGKAWHYGDEEEQIMFWGPHVDPRSIIVLSFDENSGKYGVEAHPLKSRKYLRENIFTGEYAACVNWVQKNIGQYRKVITGW